MIDEYRWMQSNFKFNELKNSKFPGFSTLTCNFSLFAYFESTNDSVSNLWGKTDIICHITCQNWSKNANFLDFTVLGSFFRKFE